MCNDGLENKVPDLQVFVVMLVVHQGWKVGQVVWKEKMGEDVAEETTYLDKSENIWSMEWK